jgi:2-phosphosulfolactate phosphatase
LFTGILKNLLKYVLPSFAIMLTIETFRTAQEARNDHTLRHSVAIVIDVLRATTSISTALHNGARRIIPVAALTSAQELASQLRAGVSQEEARYVLLCGERQGIKPTGFDLGNSPLEYTTTAVQHKTLILTTTNGTQALERTRHAALQLAVGFTNLRASVEYLLHYLHTPKLQPTRISSIRLVCAGTEGALSEEDTLCAGAFIDALLAEEPALQPDEHSFTAFKNYASLSDDSALHNALRTTPHALYLASLGFGRDVEAALQRDSTPAVARVYHEEDYSILSKPR